MHGLTPDYNLTPVIQVQPVEQNAPRDIDNGTREQDGSNYRRIMSEPISINFQRSPEALSAPRGGAISAAAARDTNADDGAAAATTVGGPDNAQTKKGALFASKSNRVGYHPPPGIAGSAYRGLGLDGGEDDKAAGQAAGSSASSSLPVVDGERSASSSSPSTEEDFLPRDNSRIRGPITPPTRSRDSQPTSVTEANIRRPQHAPNAVELVAEFGSIPRAYTVAGDSVRLHVPAGCMPEATTAGPVTIHTSDRYLVQCGDERFFISEVVKCRPSGLTFRIPLELDFRVGESDLKKVQEGKDETGGIDKPGDEQFEFEEPTEYMHALKKRHKVKHCL